MRISKVILCIFLYLFTVNCSNEAETYIEGDGILNVINIKTNPNNTYENELSTSLILDDEEIYIYASKKNGSIDIDDIEYKDENGSLYNYETNKTRDTAYIYEKNKNGNILETALRLINLPDGNNVLELVNINSSSKEVTILEHFFLERKTRNSKENKKSNSNKSVAENPDDIELQESINDVGETTSYMADTYTAPGWGIAIAEGIGNLFKEDELVIDDGEQQISILDKIGSKGKALLKSLSEIKTTLTTAKTAIKTASREGLKRAIKSLKESELVKKKAKELKEYIKPDCNGNRFGNAYYDYCNICVEGQTGLEPCVKDCNDIWGGNAYRDNCNECVGGNTGKEECGNYKLQIGNYKSDYSLINPIMTLGNGDKITLPNFMTQMVRLTLNDIPVTVGQYGLEWTQVDFGFQPESASNLVIPDYKVTIYDATNRRFVSVKLNVTLTNQSYNKFVGKKIILQRGSYGTPSAGTRTITFNQDGTYDVKSDSNGSSYGSGSYSFTPVISQSHQNCNTYTNTDVKVGCIRLSGGASGGFSYPDFIMLYEDGKLRANGSYSCNNIYNTWHLN